MGGLGTLFAAVVTPVLRSLNRYTVFVYGASLLVLASVLDADQARAAASHAPLPPFLPKRLACDLRLFVAALLGACVGIELLASSRLLNIGRIRAQSAPSPSASVLPSLREMLPARERVWFAPYTTFPEIMAVESGLRQGPYDTFQAFPPDGITTNFGAFKLSPADSAFAQAAAANLPGELGLAARLGYGWFAVDLGAIKDSAGLRQQCMSRGDCRLSGDGYALFPLTGSAPLRPSNLAPYRRLLPDFAQRSAAPRWGSLVFKADRWWPPAESSVARAGRRSLWARTGWDAEVYRFRREEVPPLLRPLLTPPRERLWLVLSPGLGGADLCLKPKVSRSFFGAPPPCQKLQLRRGQPRVEISRWILPGRITRIHTEGLYGPDGMPLAPEMSIPSPPGVPGPAAFALEVENPEIPAGV
jgi:hypothetical protein